MVDWIFNLDDVNWTATQLQFLLLPIYVKSLTKGVLNVYMDPAFIPVQLNVCNIGIDLTH